MYMYSLTACGAVRSIMTDLGAGPRFDRQGLVSTRPPRSGLVLHSSALLTHPDVKPFPTSLST